MGKIDNEYAPVVDILNEIFGKCKNHNEYTGQISYDCPVCSYEIKGLDHTDGKGNLEINYHLGVGKCWVCSETHDTHGTLYSLIYKFGNKKQLERFKILMPTDGQHTERTYARVKLPKEFIPFTTASDGLKMTHYYKAAENYLKSRNITLEIIKKYNIGFCYEGDYMNRIIIPSYDEKDELNYFTARSYETRNKLKYKNPEAQKEIIIFNENLIDWDKPIYLVEGPFDSLFLDNSIPMLGKVMSDYLFNKLYEKACEIRIVLDGDAYKNAELLYHRLNNGRLFGKISVSKLPIDKDIAELNGDISFCEPMKID